MKQGCVAALVLAFALEAWAQNPPPAGGGGGGVSSGGPQNGPAPGQVNAPNAPSGNSGSKSGGSSGGQKVSGQQQGQQGTNGTPFQGQLIFKLMSSGEVRLPKLDTAFKDYPGVSGVAGDGANKTISMSYQGTYEDLPKVESKVNDLGVQAVLVSPLRVVMTAAEGKKKGSVEEALRQVGGTSQVINKGGSYEIYTEIMQVNLAGYLKAAENAGSKGTIRSHEWLVYDVVPTKSKAAPDKVNEAMIKLQGVLRADIDYEKNQALVFVIKSQASKSRIEKELEKLGYPLKPAEKPPEKKDK